MTLYEMLGLDMSASASQIEEAYSRLLPQYSRDAAMGDRSAAKKISDLKYAKKTLLDPETRKDYDENLRRDLSKNDTIKRVSLKKEGSNADEELSAELPDAPAGIVDPTAAEIFDAPVRIVDHTSERSPTDEEPHQTDIMLMTMTAEKTPDGSKGILDKFPKDFIIKNLLTLAVVLATVIVINICI